jgi:hypothetical protein
LPSFVPFSESPAAFLGGKYSAALFASFPTHKAETEKTDHGKLAFDRLDPLAFSLTPAAIWLPEPCTLAHLSEPLPLIFRGVGNGRWS